MEISDELLSAYVDAELSDAQRVFVEQAMVRDGSVAKRVQRLQALRSRLRESYDAVLEEHVPECLIEAAQRVASTDSAPIVDLAAVRARQQRGGVRSFFAATSVRAAIAASLAIGVLLGFIVSRVFSGGGLLESRGASIVARGALAAALDRQLADAPPPGAAIRIGLSFRTRGAHYCRTFTASGAGGLAGLACHERRQWQVLTLIEGASRSAQPEYRMAASSLPPLLLQSVNQIIAGAPLDAPAERRARDQGWR